MSRDLKYTLTEKQQEYYSDFMINFDLNPITGYLAKLTNEDSVKQALKNLVLTNRGERFYNSFIGSRVSSLLFEPMDSVTQTSIENEIRETILNNEPRVELIDIKAIPDFDNNAYNIKIIFSLINKLSEPQELNIVLKRVR